MCSFFFIKEAHALLAVSPVTWHSTGAVPLCEATLPAARRVPYCPGRARGPRKEVLRGPSHRPCPCHQFSPAIIPSTAIIPVPTVIPVPAVSPRLCRQPLQHGQHGPGRAFRFPADKVWHLQATLVGEPGSLAEGPSPATALVAVPSQPHAAHASPSPCQCWGCGPVQGVPGRSLQTERAQFDQSRWRRPRGERLRLVLLLGSHRCRGTGWAPACQQQNLPGQPVGERRRGSLSLA